MDIEEKTNKYLEALAIEHGVECVFRPNGHVQLRGDLLVNYYPHSKKRSAYVAGTVKGDTRVTPEKAIAMCFEAPALMPKKYREKRKKGQSRRQRAAMINKGITRCFWCKEPVTLDTSTVEHKIPLARGGLDNANNRTLACKKCNGDRGCDMPELTQNDILLE